MRLEQFTKLRASEVMRLHGMGPNKQVRLLDARGAERVLAENARTDGYSFPAPAPDQRHLAYVSEDDSGAAIELLDVVSAERKEVYHSSTSVPIDLAWSPDGKYIVFLAGAQLTAQIVPADGSLPAHLIATGAPLSAYKISSTPTPSRSAHGRPRARGWPTVPTMAYTSSIPPPAVPPSRPRAHWGCGWGETSSKFKVQSSKL